MFRHAFTKGALGIAEAVFAGASMPTADQEYLIARTTPKVAGDTGRKDDDREWHRKEKNCQEGSRGDPQHDIVFQGPLTDAHHGFEHDCENSGFESEEQRLDDAHFSVAGINP